MLQDACSKVYDSRFNPRLCLGDGEGCVSEHAHDRLRRVSLDGFERPDDSRRNNSINEQLASDRWW